MVVSGFHVSCPLFSSEVRPLSEGIPLSEGAPLSSFEGAPRTCRLRQTTNAPTPNSRIANATPIATPIGSPRDADLVYDEVDDDAVVAVVTVVAAGVVVPTELVATGSLVEVAVAKL